MIIFAPLHDSAATNWTNTPINTSVCSRISILFVFHWKIKKKLNKISRWSIFKFVFWSQKCMKESYLCNEILGNFVYTHLSWTNQNFGSKNFMKEIRCIFVKTRRKIKVKITECQVETFSLVTINFRIWRFPFVFERYCGVLKDVVLGFWKRTNVELALRKYMEIRKCALRKTPKLKSLPQSIDPLNPSFNSKLP